MFAERPDDETAMSTSPGLGLGLELVDEDVLVADVVGYRGEQFDVGGRLSTCGARSVAVRMPLTWSHCMWLAIDAEPPLPQENSRAPLV